MMRKHVVIGWVPLVLVAVAFLAYVPRAGACSIVGCGDPLLAASDPGVITGLLRLQLDPEYLRVDAGTDGQPGFTDQLTQWSYRINAVYRPLSRLSFVTTLPFLDKTIHTVGGGTDITASHVSGLGDVELGARYALWRSINLGVGRVQEFALAGGIVMPSAECSTIATARPHDLGDDFVDTTGSS